MPDHVENNIIAIAPEADINRAAPCRSRIRPAGAAASEFDFAAVVELATRTALNISALPTASEQTAALRRHIEASDVFLGIVSESTGAHQILVKGRKALEQVVTTGRPKTLVQGAILVSCDEEAIAMRHVFGDGEERHRRQ